MFCVKEKEKDCNSQYVRLAGVAAMQTFYPNVAAKSSFPQNSLTFRENTSARPIPIVISHIPVMQFRNNSISPAAPALSSSGWHACPRPVIGRGLLAGSALLFSRFPLNSARQAAERMKCFLLLRPMKEMTVNLKIC